MPRYTFSTPEAIAAFHRTCDSPYALLREHFKSGEEIAQYTLSDGTIIEIEGQRTIVLSVKASPQVGS